jgi:hypothetical protein
MEMLRANLDVVVINDSNTLAEAVNWLNSWRLLGTINVRMIY